MGILKHNIL